MLVVDVLRGHMPGLLLAAAYPERIAQQQGRSNRRAPAQHP